MMRGTIIHMFTLFMWSYIFEWVVSSSILLTSEKVFSLQPRHVWHGMVTSQQIGGGALPLCVDAGLWSIDQADQVCHNLGFSKGAMVFGVRTIEADARKSVKCVFLGEEGIYCRIHSSRCTSGAWVSCQFSGLVGCYPIDHGMMSVLERMRNIVRYTDSELTIQSCTARCQANRYFYAGLEGDARCYCMNQLPGGAGGDGREKCDTPCSGDVRQACGGDGHMALYESQLGECNGTYILDRADTIYLASPGFPGNFRSSPIQCNWMFNLPTFNSLTMTVQGMDFTRAETLRVMALEAESLHTTFNETWTSDGSGPVRRGTWELELENGTHSAVVAVIFDASQASTGDRQFLISFSINIVDP